MRRAHAKRLREPRHVGAAESLLLLPVHHMDARLLCAHPVDDFARAIGRVVVEEQQLAFRRKVLEHRRRQRFDILPLIVGRYYGNWFHGRRL